MNCIFPSLFQFSLLLSKLWSILGSLRCLLSFEIGLRTFLILDLLGLQCESQHWACHLNFWSQSFQLKVFNWKINEYVLDNVLKMSFWSNYLLSLSLSLFLDPPVIWILHFLKASQICPCFAHRAQCRSSVATSAPRINAFCGMQMVIPREILRTIIYSLFFFLFSLRLEFSYLKVLTIFTPNLPKLPERESPFHHHILIYYASIPPLLQTRKLDKRSSWPALSGHLPHQSFR